MTTKHVAVRLDEKTLSKVDAMIPSLSSPWLKAKRSDALRKLIYMGLERGISSTVQPTKARQRPER